MYRPSGKRVSFDQGNVLSLGNTAGDIYKTHQGVYHLSIEEALTRPVKPNGGQACRDHQGTRFRSRTLMCEHWNMDRKLFEYRISHGWSLEDALTKPRRGA